MEKNIKPVLEVLDEQGIAYRHYTEDQLVEIDLGGQDRLQPVMQLITDHLEEWCYERLLSLEFKIEFDFERISITY